VDIRWRGPRIAYAGNVQPDGSITVGDMQKAIIYQSAGGNVIGTINLDGNCGMEQYFIDRDKVIVPSYCYGAATFSIYDYPAGGAPITTLTGFKSAFGAVVSR